MKSVIILLLCIGLSFATDWDPTWNVSNSYNNTYKPVSVTGTERPRFHNIDTVQVCGIAQADFTTNGFTYQTVVNGEVIYTGKTPGPTEQVKAGKIYCFFSYFMGDDKDWTLRLILDSPDDHICAVDIEIPPVERRSIEKF